MFHDHLYAGVSYVLSSKDPSWSPGKFLCTLHWELLRSTFAELPLHLAPQNSCLGVCVSSSHPPSEELSTSKFSSCKFEWVLSLKRPAYLKSMDFLNKGKICLLQELIKILCGSNWWNLGSSHCLGVRCAPRGNLVVSVKLLSEVPYAQLLETGKKHDCNGTNKWLNKNNSNCRKSFD